MQTRHVHLPDNCNMKCRLTSNRVRNDRTSKGCAFRNVTNLVLLMKFLLLTVVRSFMDVILEDDFPTMEKEWHNLTVLKMKRTFELRLRKKWYHADSKKWKTVWIIAAASPVQNEDGSLKSVMGCITDISLQKQAQEDALERATLSEQITRITQEVNESEKKFKQMAELSPCGEYLGYGA